ncbi:MAG TPA: DEAD/DEAH box helicase [Microthrixaceae bacterium]|nr:DEAD/DEAH box helicase [Microthrixaceae bacterium]
MTDLVDLDPAAQTSQRIAVALEKLLDDRRLVHLQDLAPRDARVGSLSTPLSPHLIPHVPFSHLWTHQADAIDRVRAGRSVVVATGTASGKSLCYQVPIAESVSDDATSLLIYPTKALAQDQLMSLTSWGVPGLTAATYDGDCTPEERSWVRGNANVLLTNPEMLHQAILANHQRWSSFLSRLKYVVVDELHVFRGIFGTHMSHVMRRLRRLIRHYGGAEPTFVFTSATIGAPEELASSLSGVEVEVIDVDASPRGSRKVALWNPAETADDERWSVNVEAAQLAAGFIDAGLRTLVFCSSRRSTELVAEQIRGLLPRQMSSTVRSYRGGYLRDERREIESALFSGELNGIVATSALELGVDIGGLDAVVLCGYPGTIASFRQQTGRTGRSTDDSIAVMVAGENQLDQWMMANPEELFGRRPERAVVNLDNPFVFVPHLGCAAHELPLRHRDEKYWPTQLDEGIRHLVLTDRAKVRTHRTERLVNWSGRGAPAPTLSLRSAGRGEFRIAQADGTVIGTVDESSLYQSTHMGAIYLHQGSAWKVTGLDFETRTVIVVADPGKTYTQARSSKQLQVISVTDQRQVGLSKLHLGSVEVATRVTGYQLRNSATHKIIASETLDVPSSELSTRAVWYSFDDALIERAEIDPADLGGALHAAEHAAIGILPLFTICDRWDVGGVSTEWLESTGTPTVVIHDAYPGGAGMAEMAFEAADRHLWATLDVLRKCRCSDGCPSCVQSPKCGNGNEPLDKSAAIRLLAATLGD